MPDNYIKLVSFDVIVFVIAVELHAAHLSNESPTCSQTLIKCNAFLQWFRYIDWPSLPLLDFHSSLVFCCCHAFTIQDDFTLHFSRIVHTIWWIVLKCSCSFEINIKNMCLENSIEIFSERG